MSVAFRDDAQVVNGTAGTSVVVSKPAGTADGDVLIAFIAETGTGTITAPGGWTLIGSQAASTNVTLAAYRKVASGEGASWTWTLGASVRNWGWVGAYTGVDTSSPIVGSDPHDFTSSGTSFPADPEQFSHRGDGGVGVVAAVRAATGSATTWETSSTERADMSTNGGAGTDIGGCVGDTVNTTTVDAAFYGPVLTASQSQTHGVTWTIILRAAFVSYDGGRLDPIVKMAFGADPDGDPDGWTFTDISSSVLQEQGITGSVGRPNEASRATPASVRFTLHNATGDFTPGLATGAHYPNIRRNTPVQIAVPFGYLTPSEIVTVFVDSWTPRWDEGERAPVVDVVASGRLQRMQQGSEPLRSALFRTIMGFGVGDDFEPVAYWPMEDGSGATRGAAATPNTAPAAVTGLTFGADGDIGGSLALPTMSTGATAWFIVPAYAAAATWCVVNVMRIPASVSTSALLMDVYTTGTAAIWRMELLPGSPDTLRVSAYTAHFASTLFTDDVAITEGDIYAQPIMCSLGVVTDGSDIDYFASIFNATTGITNSGTLAAQTHGNVTAVATVAFNADLDGATLGHCAVYADANFDPDADPVVLSLSLDGHSGETPESRFQRLCQEQGIEFDIVDGGLALDNAEMGPQPAAAMAETLQECEDVDAGLLHDGGANGALVFTLRASRYNAAVALTLDRDLGQLSPQFGPTFDDQRIRNDVTVHRRNGSSARVQDTASIAAEGRYADEVTLNLHNDTQPADHASWRVHLGTVEQMRYPRLAINFRRTPELVEDWLASRIGSRVQVTNLMATHPPDPVDQFMEGYQFRLSTDTWIVEPVCSPASPHRVIEADDDVLARVDTAGAELAEAIDSDDTAFDVVTTDGPTWTTTEEPFDIRVGGEQMTVTAVTSSVVDTFTRTESNGWGTADTGQVWTTLGGSASDYSTTGTLGRITIPTSDTASRSVLLPDTYSDVEIRTTAKVGGVAATASRNAYVRFRHIDASNYYRLQLSFDTAGTVDVTLAKVIAGSVTSLDSVANHVGYSAGSDVHVYVSAYGPALRVKVWIGATEPNGWTVQATDTTYTSGLVGLMAQLTAGNTNTNPTTDFDNLTLSNPQTFTVTRSVNGVVKSHAAGAPLTLWTPATLAL